MLGARAPAHHHSERIRSGEWPRAETEELLAPYLVLLIGRLTGWNAPPWRRRGADPVYLTADEKAQLAAEGIYLWASCLPGAVAQQVTPAIQDLPRAGHPDHDDMMMRIGALGGIFSAGHAPGAPLGCCVLE
jgi:hypothetical protein